MAAALTLGGNVRVGLEDNLYLPNGELAKSSAEGVETAVTLAHLTGVPIATVAEAREKLQIPRR